MAPSASTNHSNRLILTIIIVLGFVGGFCFGRLKEDTLIQWGLKAPSLRVLLSNEEIFPKSLQLLLERESGYNFEIRTYSGKDQLTEMAKFFDILIGPHCDLIALKNTEAEILGHPELAADFQSVNETDSTDLPVLWRFKSGEQFKLYSLKIKKDKTSDRRVMQVLKTLLKSDFIQTWSETTDLATTFSMLDDSSLEPELKSSALRQIPLQNLVSIKPLTCSD